MKNKTKCAARAHERSAKGFGLLNENLGRRLMYGLLSLALIFGLIGGVSVQQPQECWDGNDNDNDGLIDGGDPGCRITGSTSEEGNTDCDDQIDNDGDGKIDWTNKTVFGDTGCEITDGQSEEGNTDCDDQIDNDNDALIDGADPGCMVTNYLSEIGNTQCSDNIDNDEDGVVDTLDPGCRVAWGNDETSQCDDGLDNDGDGFTDFPEDQECRGIWDGDEGVHTCDDGLDNDGDGLTDFPEDPGCFYSQDYDEFDPTPPPNEVDVGSSGSMGGYAGIPAVHWTDQITIDKSLGSPGTITWVGIIITTDNGKTITGVMIDIGPDPSNLVNNIYSYTFTPYPAWGAAHIQVIEHRTTGDVVEDFSIYIDPSGYIFDAITLAPIQGATVTLTHENPPDSGMFVFVPVQTPALMIPNVNPQTSDATGHYGWDVVPGTYRVDVTAPGYESNFGGPVDIPPAVTNLNVYLTPNPECYDNDGDGYYGTTAECSTGTDCNDYEASINPGATEICGNDVDENCDGTPSRTCVDIDPDTLNLKCNGQRITAYIELMDYDVNNIDVSTVSLSTPSGDNTPVDSSAPATVDDHDSDGVSDLMVKFDRAAVVHCLGRMDVEGGETGADREIELMITGNLRDGTLFEGSDIIRVIDKGK